MPRIASSSGAVIAGLAADQFGLAGAMWLTAAITAAAGVIAALRMRETLEPLSV